MCLKIVNEKMIKSLIISLFFLLYSMPVFSQTEEINNILLPELLDVHFNQAFYANGENIWYKVYTLNPNIQTIKSKIVHIELLDRNGKILEEQKLSLTGNYAFGDFKIPFTWSEDYYVFRAYTQWSLNYGQEAIFTKKIPIYQISTKDTIPTQLLIDTLPQVVEQGDLKINFFSNSTDYEPRNNVTLIIDVRDNNDQPVRASLSLSVTDANFLPTPILEKPSKFKQLTPPIHFHYSYEEQINLQGTLIDTTTQKGIDTEALSLFLPQQQRFYRANVTEGNFLWTFPDFYGNTDLQVYNLSLGIDQLTPQINVTSPSLPFIDIPKEKLPRNAEVQQYLYRLYQNRLMNEVFETPVPTTTLVQKVAEKQVLKADKSYKIEEFIKIKDVGEFIDEVILTARVNGSIDKENRSVQLFNTESKTRFRNPPMYLINGQFTSDEKAVLNMPLAQIEQIETFVETKTIDAYFDPLFVTRGVLSINTKNGIVPDFVQNAPNQIQLTGLYNPRKFQLPKVVDTRSPLFSPTIFWQPNLITNEYGKANISIPLTDVVGKVFIKIEAISIKGERGSQIHELLVR